MALNREGWFSTKEEPLKLDLSPRQEISFGYDWASNEKKNAHSSLLRAETLFNSYEFRDPVHPYQTLSSFTLVPSEFLKKAHRCRPSSRDATVSAFSQWLYSLYSNAYGDEEDRERGKAREPAIELRRKASGSIDEDYLESTRSDWVLIHSGLRAPEDDTFTYFEIDSLRVDGVPLRGSPDLMFQNRYTSDVIIVEIKHSWMTIPNNLWPNIWGQLWCYSYIEVAKTAPSTKVVGEVWGEHRVSAEYRRKNTEVCLRASVHRDPRSPAFDRFFRALFNIYSGAA